MGDDNRPGYVARVLKDMAENEKTPEYREKIRVGRIQGAIIIGVVMPLLGLFKLFHWPLGIFVGLWTVLCGFTFGVLPQYLGQATKKGGSGST